MQERGVEVNHSIIHNQSLDLEVRTRTGQPHSIALKASDVASSNLR
jgi:hypothetical protein